MAAWLVGSRVRAGEGRACRIAAATVGGTVGRERCAQVGAMVLPVEALRLTGDDAGSVLTLRWPDEAGASGGNPARLRLTLISELRTFPRLVFSRPDGTELGRADLSLGSAFETVELKLSPEVAATAVRDGVDVRAVGAPGVPILVFGENKATPPMLRPGWLVPGDLSARVEMLRRLASPAGMAHHGWQEGCVLDGLADLATRAGDGSRYRTALADHLHRAFPPEAGTALKVSRSGGSIENTSCVAQLARVHPDHPAIAGTLEFWASKTRPDGGIHNGTTTVAEGNYTVAWPLASLAKALKRPELAEKAILQLRQRRDRLVAEDGSIWLRHSPGPPVKRTYRLWSRGLTWYVLGLARTLDALDAPPADLIAELKRAAAYLLPLQDEAGFWHLFAGEAGTTVRESSGTAGVAAALAIGVRRKWLSSAEAQASRRSLKGLTAILTPDGLLPGTSPSNRGEGGEDFQRRSPGAILPWGPGLMGQLVAELEPPEA
jgi:rhamnogalacturonyl hydrolase YesR